MRPKWYVYELRQGDDVFYVGKGTGNRCLQHFFPRGRGYAAEEVRRRGRDNCQAHVVAYFYDEQDAFDHELDRMGWYQTLINVAKYKNTCKPKYTIIKMHDIVMNLLDNPNDFKWIYRFLLWEEAQKQDNNELGIEASTGLRKAFKIKWVLSKQHG